jgi:hypothetical protein
MKLNEIFDATQRVVPPKVVVFREDQTGIRGRIYASPNQAYGTQIPHGPRIKFYPTTYPGENKSYSVLPNAEQLSPEFRPLIDGKTDKQIKLWINKHQSALIEFWNGKISQEEFIKQVTANL